MITHPDNEPKIPSTTTIILAVVATLVTVTALAAGIVYAIQSFL